MTSQCFFNFQFHVFFSDHHVVWLSLPALAAQNMVLISQSIEKYEMIVVRYGQQMFPRPFIGLYPVCLTQRQVVTLPPSVFPSNCALRRIRPCLLELGQGYLDFLANEFTRRHDPGKQGDNLRFNYVMSIQNIMIVRQWENDEIELNYVQTTLVSVQDIRRLCISQKRDQSRLSSGFLSVTLSRFLGSSFHVLQLRLEVSAYFKKNLQYPLDTLQALRYANLTVGTFRNKKCPPILNHSALRKSSASTSTMLSSSQVAKFAFPFPC